MSEIKTTYREVEITYSQDDNSWNCELFSKPAESLVAAKIRIDKKLDAEKKQPFVRFKAFVHYLNGKSWPLVEVTSITEDHKEAWCVLNSERENYGGFAPIYPNTPENIATVAEIHEIEKAQKELGKRMEQAVAKMVRWQPAPDAQKGEP